MALDPANDWRTQFGLSSWPPPMFFASKKDIDAAGPDFPQAHALRRAFDSMGLNGIVCFGRTPAIYFKEVPRFSWEEVRGLRRQFWSQGLAPGQTHLIPHKKAKNRLADLVVPSRLQAFLLDAARA